MELKRPGSQPSLKGPAEYFTGILADREVMKLVDANGQKILGGSSINHPDFWNGAPTSPTQEPIASNDARNKFSLNGCNACHGSETQTVFTHIKPRSAGASAGLSEFLTGDGVSPNPELFAMKDPVVPSTCPSPAVKDKTKCRVYGDLARRAQDMDKLLGSTCVGFGLIRESLFEPLRMTH